MGKYCQIQSTFQFAWDQVSTAFWQRYPNPYSNHVLSEDVIYREILNGKLFSKRLITKTNSLPKWGERFLPSSATKHVYILEESIVDPESRTVTTYTRNIGLTKIMSLVEKVTYQQISDKTRCNRQVWINSNVFGFSRAIQAFAIERFKKNVTKTIHGYNYVLEKMFPKSELAVILSSERASGTLRNTAKKAHYTAKKATEFAKAGAKAGQNRVASLAGQTH